MSQSRNEADPFIQGARHVTSVSVVRCRICSGRPHCTGNRSRVRTNRSDGYGAGPEGGAACEAGHDVDEAIDAAGPACGGYESRTETGAACDDDHTVDEAADASRSACVETRTEPREPGFEEPGDATAPGRDDPAARRINPGAGCATG